MRFLRGLPPAYAYGGLALAVGVALLMASLLSYVGLVDVVVVTGEAPPGTAEREVPFNRTSFFRAALAIESCGVALHLLTDSEYDGFLLDGRLPPPTVDCNQTEALVRSRVGHIVTVYDAAPGASAVPYVITAAFFAERHPYALLSVPGAILGMASTIWIATAMLHRRTEKLAADFRERLLDRKAK